MASKDYFSEQSKTYASFRPTYPAALYDYIFSHLRNKRQAWDCATGNGQVAQYLCNHFEKVVATDLSEQQISQAYQAANIDYSVAKAEDTIFEDNQFDLITVAQALHWIDTTKFYGEVNRTGKANSLLAVWGYSLLSVTKEIDAIFNEYYSDTVGPYWDSVRRLIEQEYKTIPFPFDEIESPRFQLIVHWTPEQFAGYLSSWSATQKYIKMEKTDPVPAAMERIEKFWSKNEKRKVIFPLFLRLGRIEPS